MKYRTKLYLAIFAITIASFGFGVGFIISDFFEHVIVYESASAVSVAATTAVFLNPEDLKKIRTPADMNTATYRKIQTELRHARDANQRQHLWVSWLYIVRPDPTDPKTIVYVVDAESNPSLTGYPGEALTPVSYVGLPEHLDHPWSSGHIYTDAWGSFLTGYAPIFDAEGHYVATVGADFPGERILAIRIHYIESIVYIFCGVIVLSFVGSYLLSRRETKSLRTLHKAVQEIGKGNLDLTVTVGTRDEFEDLAKQINAMTQGLKERERLKVGMTRYVSEHILDQIISSEIPAKLEGERRKVTILFSDIRGFTHLSEAMPPEQVVALLNEYFEAMIEVIFRHKGTLDKFLGDGIMVEFGAPLEDPEQERHAIETAIEMQQELSKLNALWKEANRPTLNIGIGIHTGLAIVGSIGSAKRMEYTAIGDTVNIASRLQAATKSLNQPILASTATFGSLLGHFKSKDLGPIKLPGREEPVHVYAVEPSAPSALGPA